MALRVQTLAGVASHSGEEILVEFCLVEYVHTKNTKRNGDDGCMNGYNHYNAEHIYVRE